MEKAWSRKKTGEAPEQLDEPEELVKELQDLLQSLVEREAPKNRQGIIPAYRFRSSRQEISTHWKVGPLEMLDSRSEEIRMPVKGGPVWTSG